MCVCALYPFFTSCFHSILTVSVRGLLFIVHTACYHALSTCDDIMGFPLNSREEINKGEHLQTEVSLSSATLKIDDDGPHISGSKKQVALRDSLHLANGVTLLLMTRFIICNGLVTLPQMSAGELYQN